MENEIKDLIKKIVANQVVIYKRLDTIERKLKGTTRVTPIQTYLEELKTEAGK